MQKTQNNRKGIITEGTAELIEKFRKEKKANLTDKIFVAGINALKLRLNRYLKETLGLNHSSHDFRHTKITELANSGMATKTIQTYVGHTNSLTTMRYIQVDQNEALRQVKEANIQIGLKRMRDQQEEEKVEPRVKKCIEKRQMQLKFSNENAQNALETLAAREQTLKKSRTFLGTPIQKIGARTKKAHK